MTPDLMTPDSLAALLARLPGDVQPVLLAACGWCQAINVAPGKFHVVRCQNCSRLFVAWAIEVTALGLLVATAARSSEGMEGS